MYTFLLFWVSVTALTSLDSSLEFSKSFPFCDELESSPEEIVIKYQNALSDFRFELEFEKMPSLMEARYRKLGLEGKLDQNLSTQQYLKELISSHSQIKAAINKAVYLIEDPGLDHLKSDLEDLAQEIEEAQLEKVEQSLQAVYKAYFTEYESCTPQILQLELEVDWLSYSVDTLESNLELLFQGKLDLKSFCTEVQN